MDNTRAVIQHPGENTGPIFEGQTLPPVTVVGFTDPDTRKFFDDIKKGSPFIDPNVSQDSYQALINLGKRYGFPKIKLDPDAWKGNSRPDYDYSKNIMRLQGPTDKRISTHFYPNAGEYLSEYAHKLQFDRSPFKAVSRYYWDHLVGSRATPEDEDKMYATPGTVEHQAHFNLEPKLINAFNEEYERIKAIPTKRKGKLVQLKQNAGSIDKNSIVDYLESKGIDSSKAARKTLAKHLGIDNYRYTSAQNMTMLHMMKAMDNQPTPEPLPSPQPGDEVPEKLPYIGEQPPAYMTPLKAPGFAEHTAGAIPDEFKAIFGPDLPPPPITSAGVPPPAYLRPDYKATGRSIIPTGLEPTHGKEEQPAKPKVKLKIPKGVAPPKYMAADNSQTFGQYTQSNIPTSLQPVYGKTAPVAKPVVVKSVAPPSYMKPAGTPAFDDYTNMNIPEELQPVYGKETEQAPNTIITKRAAYTGDRITNAPPDAKYVASSTRVNKQDPRQLAPQTIEDEPGFFENTMNMASNWWNRNSLKSDPNLKESESKIVQPNYNPTIITGDTLRDDKRQYHIPEVIDLNNAYMGTRNRKDNTPINTEAASVTTFNPFVSSTDYFKKSKDPADATYIGVDTNGKLKTGSKNDFMDQDYKITRTFSNKVIDFNKNADGSIWLVNSDPKASKTMLSPSIKVMGDDGKPKNGRLSMLIPKDSKDTKSFGKVTGGRYIFKTMNGDTKLVSGSLEDLKNQFYTMKKDDPYLEVITLDNGSYSRGLRTYDQKLTSKDLAAYDDLNASGGNFAYLKPSNYSDSKQQFKETYMPTPNVRTINDESYKKGHSLKNEESIFVLHHTGYTNPKTAQDEVTKQFMTPGDKSSHVVINFDGSRTRFANPDQVTFHAGESVFNGRDNVNDFSIGVEFQGDTNKKPLTDAQIQSFVEYALPIIKAKGMTLADITTHHRIAGSRKPDINERDYNRVLTALKAVGIKANGGKIQLKQRGGKVQLNPQGAQGYSSSDQAYVKSPVVTPILKQRPVRSNTATLSSYTPSIERTKQKIALNQEYANTHGGHLDADGNYVQGILNDAADSRVANRVWDNMVVPGVEGMTYLEGAGAIGSALKGAGKFVLDKAVTAAGESALASERAGLTKAFDYRNTGWIPPKDPLRFRHMGETVYELDPEDYRNFSTPDFYNEALVDLHQYKKEWLDDTQRLIPSKQLPATRDQFLMTDKERQDYYKFLDWENAGLDEPIDYFDFTKIGEGMQFNGKDISMPRPVLDQRDAAKMGINYTWAPHRMDVSPAQAYIHADPFYSTPRGLEVLQDALKREAKGTGPKYDATEVLKNLKGNQANANGGTAMQNAGTTKRLVKKVKS